MLYRLRNIVSAAITLLILFSVGACTFREPVLPDIAMVTTTVASENSIPLVVTQETLEMASSAPTITPTTTLTPVPTPTDITTPALSQASKATSTAQQTMLSLTTQATTQAIIISEATDTPQPTATPTPSASTGEITLISGGYIDETLRGINESRARIGNPPVKIDSTLNEKAQDHAFRMAEEQRMFHSKYGLFESVATGTEGALPGLALGAQSAVHAHDIMDDPNITIVGIGVYKRGDTIYACILADW